MQLNPKEVDASVWLNQKIVELITYGSDSPPQITLPVTLVNMNGGKVSIVLLKYDCFTLK